MEIQPTIITKEHVRKVLFVRDRESNKGSFGTVGLLGGSLNYSGAIKLAGLAAMRAGVGICRLIVKSDIAYTVAPELYENTLATFDDIDGVDTALKGLKALAVGMGWGLTDENKKILNHLITSSEIPLVIDADGINILANNIEWLKGAKSRVILTPHLKEFSCLTGLDVDIIKDNRLALATEFARKNRIILLLKGADTIITDGETAYISNTGTPGMATAGSGDVLSGIIAGVLGYSREPIIDTVAVAAFVNGIAGEIAASKHGVISMTARDTAECVGRAIGECLY